MRLFAPVMTIILMLSILSPLTGRAQEVQTGAPLILGALDRSDIGTRR